MRVRCAAAVHRLCTRHTAVAHHGLPVAAAPCARLPFGVCGRPYADPARLAVRACLVFRRYKTQHRLVAGGTLVLGGQQRRVGCRDGEGLGPDGAPCGWAGVQDPARGFTGSVQNLRLWNYVLSPADVGQGMVWPFVRSRVSARFGCARGCVPCSWSSLPSRTTDAGGAPCLSVRPSVRPSGRPHPVLAI